MKKYDLDIEELFAKIWLVILGICFTSSAIMLVIYLIKELFLK